jgi:hypothetical protein
MDRTSTRSKIVLVTVTDKPEPRFCSRQLDRTEQCVVCGRVLYSGETAYLLEKDLDDEDEDGERQDDDVYDPPKRIVCSSECVRSFESDYWESEAWFRDLEEELPHSTVRHRRNSAHKARHGSDSGNALPQQPPLSADAHTDQVAGSFRPRPAPVDDELADQVVETFSGTVAQVGQRLEEAMTVLKWAEAMRRGHQAACDCDRCIVAKRIRGEFSTLRRIALRFLPPSR